MNPKTFYRLLTLLPLLAALPAAAQAASDADTVAAGRRIYLDGVLPNGQPLRGLRSDSGVVSGRAAACVTCHRPSGLGTVEGTIGIPPISGRALFGGGDPVIVRMDRAIDQSFSVPHPPYSEAAFAAAVRDGRHQSGRAMNALMPRYTLSDGQLQAVAAYLKTLSNEWSPGVSAYTIHIATVIAPGVAQERRKAFLATVTTLLNQININVNSSHRQKMVSPMERRLGSRRKFALDVWELSGPASTWGEQLQRRHQEHPAFAILSGLGNGEWQPVQDFCDNNSVACWFPSVDLVPADAEKSRFSLYFSAGVALEAEVMARKLKAAGKPNVHIVQLVADDAVARGGAAKLRKALAAAGTSELKDIGFGATAADATVAIDAKAAVANLSADDALILWLRPTDLAGLASFPETKAQVFVSATLAGDERIDLPMALRMQATLVQPQEVEHMRVANLERCNAWLNAMKIQLVDQRMLSEAYFATRSLVVVVHGMLNNLHTNYLIERAESGLSMFEAMQVRQEIQDMMMGPMNKRPLSPTPPTADETAAMAATAKAQSEHLEEMRRRGGTTVYPRLSLAPGQRFASKGAYLEKLNPDAPGIIGEPEWVVP
jgi:cytochrome c553